MELQTIAEFIGRTGIRCNYTLIHARPGKTDKWSKSAYHFVVTLLNRDGEITVLYSMGSGLLKKTKYTDKPILPFQSDMAINVLGSLQTDSQCVENCVDLQDFINELGYEASNIRDAEIAYAACKQTRRELIEWLGPQLYSVLINEVESL